MVLVGRSHSGKIFLRTEIKIGNCESDLALPLGILRGGILIQGGVVETGAGVWSRSMPELPPERPQQARARVLGHRRVLVVVRRGGLSVPRG